MRTTPIRRPGSWQDVETGSSFFERTYRRRRGKGRPLSDHGGLPRLARPKGCVAERRGRSAAGPAWLVKAPLPGSDGRTNPLCHRRLFTDSPSRAATRSAPPGRGTDRVLGTRAEPWRSGILERRCADDTNVTWGSAHVRRSRRNG